MKGNENLTASRNFYFVQLTDIHIGTSPKPQDAARLLRWALSELDSFDPKPEIILCTGDSVCNGTCEELREFRHLMDSCSIPFAALPANHDLWGEKDNSAWAEIIGPMRKSVTAGNFKFLLWNDIKRTEKGWNAIFTDEDFLWLKTELEGAEAQNLNVIAAVHNPPDRRGKYDSNCSRWSNEDTERLLNLLAQYPVKALISGDYHTNDCWLRNGVLKLNSASLAGMIWNGLENFPVKPGYRLYHWDGEMLRTFWREGSYWPLDPHPEERQKYCAGIPLYHFRYAGNLCWPIMHYERAQISLKQIGGCWTGGPRPVVRTMYICDRTVLHADVFSQFFDLADVSWSLMENDWRPMKKVWNGLWSEWQAEFDPDEFRNGGYLLKVRALPENGSRGFFDAVPVRLCGPRLAPKDNCAVFAGSMQANFTLRTPFD